MSTRVCRSADDGKMIKDNVLKTLLSAEGFVSGQELCDALGVSRTSVWKAIEALRADGYKIEAVTNKGYLLVKDETADILNQEELERALETRWAGHPVIFKKETGSTNDDIMAMADQGAPQGTLAVTVCQHAGKGRRGRVWLSPDVGNVYMSILLRPQMDASRAPMLTLIMALAVYEALQDMPYDRNKVRFGIKWPNDVVVSVDDGPYKKTCGILTEMRMEEREIRDVTVGIGLNVNMTEFPEEIKETATSFALALGHPVRRAQFVADIWRHFENDCDVFLRDGDLEGLRPAYEAGLVNIGRAVRVLDPKGEYTGSAKGITADGELIVIPDGQKDPVYVGNGEISVRGVMGYV